VQDRLRDVDALDQRGEGVADRVRGIEQEVDEILDRLHELDKSWKNNLVFYGLRTESYEDPASIEMKIRELIARKMQISREISISRVKRSYNGPQVRGSRPITVAFESWRDKEEILRKSKLLKGSNIFVDEDFSKRVKENVRIGIRI